MTAQTETVKEEYTLDDKIESAILLRKDIDSKKEMLDSLEEEIINEVTRQFRGSYSNDKHSVKVIRQKRTKYDEKAIEQYLVRYYKDLIDTIFITKRVFDSNAFKVMLEQGKFGDKAKKFVSKKLNKPYVKYGD